MLMSLIFPAQIDNNVFNNGAKSPEHRIASLVSGELILERLAIAVTACCFDDREGVVDNIDSSSSSKIPLEFEMQL